MARICFIGLTISVALCFTAYAQTNRLLRGRGGEWLSWTPVQRTAYVQGFADKETVVIGYEESSQLDVEPAKYFVLVTKREKRACRSCEDLGVVSAPLPPRIIEKCLASDRIVIDTVVSKYCDHTPLHRQSMSLERDLGLEISRATLDGWVLKVGELLIPVVAAMRRELISGSYIQADETPVDVQTREGRGKNHQAYLWQYSRPGETQGCGDSLGRGKLPQVETPSARLFGRGSPRTR